MRLCVGVSCEEWGCHSTSQSDAVPHMYSEIYPPSNEEYSTEEQMTVLVPTLRDLDRLLCHIL